MVSLDDIYGFVAGVGFMAIFFALMWAGDAWAARRQRRVQQKHRQVEQTRASIANMRRQVQAELQAHLQHQQQQRRCIEPVETYCPTCWGHQYPEPDAEPRLCVLHAAVIVRPLNPLAAAELQEILRNAWQ